MKRYHTVIGIELDLYVNAKSEKDVVICLENMELPQGYRENSFKIIFVEKLKD